MSVCVLSLYDLERKAKPKGKLMKTSKTSWRCSPSNKTMIGNTRTGNCWQTISQKRILTNPNSKKAIFAKPQIESVQL